MTLSLNGACAANAGSCAIVTSARSRLEQPMGIACKAGKMVAHRDQLSSRLRDDLALTVYARAQLIRKRVRMIMLRTTVRYAETARLVN